MGTTSNYLYEKYKPQLSKTLEGMQKWVLHKRHDFGFGSIIADEIINVLNKESTEFELMSGIRRVYPGQLVWERKIKIGLPNHWCDESRYERKKRKLIISRYTQSMIMSIVSERISVHNASLIQLKNVVQEFLEQGYIPDIDDLVAIGGVSFKLAEEILLSCGDLISFTPLKKRKKSFNFPELEERLINKLSKLISRRAI